MLIKTCETSYHTLDLTIERLYKLIFRFDPAIAYHSNNVKNIALLLADKLTLSQQVQSDIATAALLHDIGKIMIPKFLLDKPGKLTPEEYKIIKKHSCFGYQIINNILGFQHIAKFILYHHEFFNGAGYPTGKYGQEIPLISRILTLSDFYEALTSDRCYRKALSKERTVEMIIQSRGIQFDPVLVDAFLRIRDLL